MAAASKTYAAIQKNILGPGTVILVFSNEDLNDIMKIVKSLEESSLLIKGVSETIGNKKKQIKRRIFRYFSSYISF